MTTPTLAGEERALSGHVEPRNDEVLAVFRNGKVEDIYAPGRRLRALWRSYKPGTLTYARILRADIGFETTVRDVSVKDDWTLPLVSVTTFVALNAESNYAALRARLSQRGLGFMAALSAELNAEMDRFVRRLVAPLNHDDVVQQQTPDNWGHAAMLMQGLFVVDRLMIKTATSDPQYEAMTLARRGTRVDEAENSRAAAMAGARGLSLTDWENPDRNAQSHELQMAMMQAELERERLKLEALRAQYESQTAIQVAELNNIRAVHTARRAGLVREATPSIDPAQTLGASSPESVLSTPAPQNVIDVPEADTSAQGAELARDPRLIKAWTFAGGSATALVGAVEVRDGGGPGLTVLVHRGNEVSADVQRIASAANPRNDVVVLAETSTVPAWVATLIARRAPGVTDQITSLAVERRADGITIVVASAPGRTTAVIKKLSSPETLVVAALSELLLCDVRCDTVAS